MKNWLQKNLDLSKLKEMMIKNKRILLVFAVVFVCFAVFLWKNNQWVMKVNDQKIAKDEYAFYQKIHPLLTEEELQKQIVEDKVQLQQAKKLKIETIDNYSDLTKEMEKVNKENKKKIQNRQVIYGLREYNEESFYSYSLSTTVNQIKEKLNKNFSDKAVKDYYSKNKKNFKTIDSKELYRVQTSKEKLKELVVKKLTLEQIEGDESIQCEKVVLDESRLRDWLKYRENEFQVVDILKKGTWSELFGDEKKAWSYYCISTQPGTIQPLTEVQESIKIRLEKDYYQAELDKWIKQAKVESRLRREK